MSERSECPGCGSETSSVLTADREGNPCPYCGLSWAARSEINRVRNQRGDDKLKARIEELVKENADLKEKLSIYQYAYDEISHQVRDASKRLAAMRS